MSGEKGVDTVGGCCSYCCDEQRERERGLVCVCCLFLEVSWLLLFVFDVDLTVNSFGSIDHQKKKGTATLANRPQVMERRTKTRVLGINPNFNKCPTRYQHSIVPKFLFLFLFLPGSTSFCSRRVKPKHNKTQTTHIPHTKDTSIISTNGHSHLAVCTE